MFYLLAFAMLMFYQTQALEKVFGIELVVSRLPALEQYAGFEPVLSRRRRDVLTITPILQISHT